MQSNSLPNIVLSEVVNIAHTIKINHTSHPSLFAGFSGEALLISELVHLTQKDEYIIYLEELIEKIIDSFSEYPLTSTLSGGVTGIASVLTYFSKKGFIQPNQIDDLYEIDEHICLFARKSLSDSNWDYLYGGAGALSYLLEHPKYNLYTKTIEQGIKSISKLGIQVACGLKWPVYPFNEELRGNPEYNIGLAHGSLSIISLLLKSYKKNILAKECRLLIEQAVSFILSQQLPVSERSRFPTVEKKMDLNFSASPLGWCRGDLTIAIILLDVSRTFHDKSLFSFAITLASDTLNDDFSKGGYFDACFCHGTAGIAHLYNRLHRQTQNNIFHSRMNYWIEQTLKLGQHTSEGTNYFSYRDGQHQPDYGLLNGMAGIGLSLAGCITIREPQWDCLFLLS